MILKNLMLMEECVNKSYLRICNNNILPYSGIFVNDALSAQQHNYQSSEKREIVEESYFVSTM